MLRADVQIMWPYPSGHLQPDSADLFNSDTANVDSLSSTEQSRSSNSDMERAKQRKTDLSVYHNDMYKLYGEVRRILVAYAKDGSEIPERPDDDSWNTLTSETLNKVEMVRQLFWDLKQDHFLLDSDRNDWKSKFERIKVSKTQVENGIKSLSNDIKELKQMLCVAENEIHTKEIYLQRMRELNEKQKTPNADSNEIENHHLLGEITTQSTQTDEVNNYFQNELKRKEEEVNYQQSQLETLSIKLKSSQDEQSKLDKRVIELENQNCHMKQQLATEREHTNSMTIERKQLEARLEEVKEELTKGKLTSETNAERLQEAQNEISQLREQHNQSDNRFAIEELQERLAISESKFDHDRSIFEEQIKHLSDELERTTKSLEEIAAENTRNVNR